MNGHARIFLFTNAVFDNYLDLKKKTSWSYHFFLLFSQAVTKKRTFYCWVQKIFEAKLRDEMRTSYP